MAEEKPFTQVLPKERCEIQEIKDVTEAYFKKRVQKINQNLNCYSYS